MKKRKKNVLTCLLCYYTGTRLCIIIVLLSHQEVRKISSNELTRFDLISQIYFLPLVTFFMALLT